MLFLCSMANKHQMLGSRPEKPKAQWKKLLTSSEVDQKWKAILESANLLRPKLSRLEILAY
jgi:hypothetical protein